MRQKPDLYQRVRVPFREPPLPAMLAKRGHELMRLKRAATPEGGEQALERARRMPWFARVVEERPYFSANWWCFVVKKEAA